MFASFFYLLRQRGLDVSLNEWLTLLQGMEQGLHRSSLTGFYQLCRAVLVKSEAEYDRFDQVFLEFFKDVPWQGELPEEVLGGITPAAGADASALGMKTGDALVAVSSLDSPSSASCIGVLDQLSVIYPNNPGQNVLQFYSETSYGSSGGAVYTQNGIWVGSISGGDTYGTCWAVPYGMILTEFQKCLIELAAQDAGQ